MISIKKYILKECGMMYMKQKKIICISVILFITILSGCNSITKQSGDNTAGVTTNISDTKQTKDQEFKLKAQDIIDKYDGGKNGKLISTETYKEYLLVEYTRDNRYTYFDWYNLKTGDKDILPVWDTHSTLKKIANENNIIFYTDGKNITDSNYKIFPFIYECIRKKEIINYEDDFFAKKVDRYFGINESCEFGSKSHEVLDDIKLTFQGIEILFTPMTGYEMEFNAGNPTIPPTKTTFIEKNNQFIIEFKDTKIGDKLHDILEKYDNFFIKSLNIKEYGNNTKIIINLKEKAKYYNAKEVHVSEEGFPVLIFTFSNNTSYKY